MTQAAFKLSRWRFVAFVLILASLGALSPAVAETEAALKARIDDLAETRSIGSVEIAAVDVIRDFYDHRGYRSAWIDADMGVQLMEAIADSERHGLRPWQFHTDALAALLPPALEGDEDAIVAFEIVATDGAIRLLHHLYFGKVNPESLDPDWNFERPVISSDPAALLNNYVEAGGFTLLVEDVSLRHPQYLALQAALDRYRAIEAQGGWPQITSDAVLKPGEEDDRVPLLRSRLFVSGDLEASGGQGNLYDAALESAVKRFQIRHGLDADGVIGPKSFTALNTPVSDRIDQIRLSLERARWILRGLEGDFVLVNIAGAETYLARDGQLVWRTRSVTGQEYRKTPVFRDEIRYMEFNPTWTVPVSIFRKDKLPKIRKDANYLSRGGYMVRNSDGAEVSPASVNWSAKNPGVTLVQRPGPSNALGLVKFMFPNKHAVYLHDTDDRSLFDRADRNLSSGCVRVEDPFVFADLLMQGAPDWSAARREDILAGGKTTRIDLPTPMPVLLTYYTAWVAEDQVQFRRDVYDRDARLLAELNGAFGQ